MDAEQLAHALGGVRSGRQWKCKCIVHEDRTPSMIIFDGREQVQVRCMSGCDPRDIINELRRRGLWHSDVHVDRPRIISHEAMERERASRMRYNACNLFNEAGPCAGTIAQRYFENREIWSVARMIDDIRFHDRCPRGHVREPAIIIAMRSFDECEVRAVQRIYLTERGTKAGDPMMLGPAGGCAMMLAPRSTQLHVAEGLESALSVQAMDRVPVWALGSCGAIERLPVLDGVHQLVVWADNDSPGVKAAAVCRDRWLGLGREVRIWVPSTLGQDPADVWRERLARG